MFENLSNRLESVFKKLRGQARISEKNIKDAMREIRRALLEADVNYKVVKNFITHITEKAIGSEVLRSVSPAQQIVKIVHDELVELMGNAQEKIKISSSPPTILMLVGLQGSGKTTACGKLAKLFRKKGHKPLLVAADIYRPAAIEQLKVLGKQLNIPVFSIDDSKNAPDIAKKAVEEAYKIGSDFIIIDTAGRLHIDKDMMKEVVEIQKTVKPTEILFVADAMTGQDAVNVAKEFNDLLSFDGIILTKLDGDARGGAALSIRMVTGKPIKYVGVGEKLDGLEPFHPDRMASRILGMGDILSFVEKAQEVIDIEKAVELERKLRKETFTLEDFLDQLQQLKKMGSLEQLIGMIPGANKLPKQALEVDDKAMGHIEAIINSMTHKERRTPKILNGSRRKRIAKGSGTTVQEVNRLINDFKKMQNMLKQLRKGGKNKLKGLPFPF